MGDIKQFRIKPINFVSKALESDSSRYFISYRDASHVKKTIEQCLNRI